MQHMATHSWFLRWYILAPITISLYAAAYVWYFAFKAQPIWYLWTVPLKKRRNRRIVRQQEAARAANQARMRTELAERLAAGAAAKAATTIEHAGDIQG